MSANGGKDFYRLAPMPHSADPGGGSNGSTRGLLMDKLAVAGDGGVAVVNSALKADSRSRVWLVRGAPGR